MNMPKCFDFDMRWAEVERVLALSKVQRALTAAMRAKCRNHGQNWEPDKGPWFYSNPPHKTPASAGTPDWYRCYGACHLLSAWCGAIGEALEPSLTWLVGYSPNYEHSAALGFVDPDDEYPQLVMDILWHYEIIDGVPAGTQEDAAALILNALSPSGEFAVTRIDDAITMIERQTLGLSLAAVLSNLPPASDNVTRDLRDA